MLLIDAIEKAGYTGKVQDCKFPLLFSNGVAVFLHVLLRQKKKFFDTDQNRNGCCSFRVFH